jgi:acylphosphatase
MVCKRVLLSGKVQGVSFRFHAYEMATKLRITGWVRNNTDGRVEMILCGLQKDVDEMIKWARKGPPLAKIEKMEVTDQPELPKQDEPFFIRRDGGK